MNRKREIAIGAALSYVQIAVGAIITLLYTPFMIRVLGQSEYGLYNTVSSVVSSLSILSLGFGSCYVRFYSKYRSENDEKNIRKLNGMFMTIFVVIGLIALLCGLYLSLHLKTVFDKGLTVEELHTAKILMLLLTGNLALSFPASVFSAIITANERFIFQKTILLIKQIASPLICIPLLLCGYASVGIVLCTVIVHLALDVCNMLFCFHNLKVKFEFGSFDFAVFKQMAWYASFIAINMIVDQINLNIDKFLLGRYRGTISVAVYSAGYTIYQYYTSFSTSLSNVFTPRIHSIWNNSNYSEIDKNNKLSGIFSQIGRMQFVILFLVCSGIVIFGKQFIAKWAGPGYENGYYVLLLLAFSAIVPLSQNIGIEIQRAKNMHQFRAIIYLCMAVINLLMSIYLCKKYGEIGSAVGTAVSFVLANTVCMNLFYHFAMKIDVRNYWKNCGRIIIASIPALIFGVLYCYLVDSYKIGSMIVGILIYTSIYLICMYCWTCSSDERAMLVKFVRQRMRNR